MILYKNVDIIDLPSILTKGVISLRESGNDNWGMGKRASNSTEVVYLFSPIGEENSFTQYGVALLEVDVPDAWENEMSERDVNRGKYREWCVERVPPDRIRAVYIPRVFQDRVVLPHTIEVIWCGMQANWYSNCERVRCPDDVLARFAETAPIMDATEFNFFRGVTEQNRIIDLYDIVYEI